MATLKTKFAVGLFVIIGISMAVVAIIWFGASHYFEKGKYYVAYFDESVQGLDKDSPVKYRGVSIGRVHSIGVAPDANLIQVILKIETSINLDQTIVAQLRSIGITGIMYVELERIGKDETVPKPKIRFSTKYPVINTKASDIKQFFETISDVFLEFKDLDMKGISERLKNTLDKMEKSFQDAEITHLADEMRITLKGIQDITDTERWNDMLDSIASAAKGIQELSVSGNKTFTQLEDSMALLDKELIENGDAFTKLLIELRASIKKIDGLVQNSNHLVRNSNKEFMLFMSQLKIALKNYENAGKNLNRFLERIADQPSQLIFGESSERTKAEK